MPDDENKEALPALSPRQRRLADECMKLHADEERACAEEGMDGELERWPEY